MKITEKTFEISSDGTDTMELIVYENVHRFKLSWSTGSEIDDHHYTSIYEYRISVDSTVEVKLLDRRCEDYKAVTTEVKNGVVLKDELQKELSKPGLSESFKSNVLGKHINERIEKLNEEIKWHVDKSEFVHFCLLHGRASDKNNREMMQYGRIKLLNPTIDEEINDGIYPCADGNTKSDLGLYTVDQEYVLRWLNQTYEKKFRIHDESDENSEAVEKFISWVQELDQALNQGKPRSGESAPFPTYAMAADLRAVTEDYLKKPQYWDDYFDFIQVYTYVYVELISFGREMKARHPLWIPKKVKELISVLSNPLTMIKDGRIPIKAFHEICLDSTKRGASIDSGVYMLIEQRIKDGVSTIAMPTSARFPEVVQQKGNKKLELKRQK